MVNIILYTAVGFVGIALILTIIRFLIGKTAVDRVIAFDIMTVTSIALIGIISHFSERIIYLDIAIVYGLLSFISVIVIAKYFEKGL